MRKSLLAIFILYTVLLSLAMAELIRPLNESKLSHIHVLFQWEEIDNTTEYEFQLSTSENFSSILIDIIITDLYYLETEKITWATTYYWRVRPHSEEWIDTYMFSILNSLSSSNLTANVYDESQYAEGISWPIFHIISPLGY